MSIELLWIIPAVAVAIFFLILILSTQREREAEVGASDQDLIREVELFNRGYHAPRPTGNGAEKRLGEIEKTIELVSTALSNQQKVIENYAGKDEAYVAQLNGLKKKLLQLQHEYDILLSENYSLRARIASLTEKTGEPDNARNAESERRHPHEDTDTLEAERLHHMRLYDDTRTFRSSDLSDTSEINLSELT